MEHADNNTLKAYKDLVANGQIEFIGGAVTVRQTLNASIVSIFLGGWVQPDEAASHYVDIIDQYTLGLRKLDANFGDCGHPKVAWQIDPFGHSREHSNLVRMVRFANIMGADTEALDGIRGRVLRTRALSGARDASEGKEAGHELEGLGRSGYSSLSKHERMHVSLDNSIFTRAFFAGYGPPYVDTNTNLTRLPHGALCWDTFCDQEPIVDDPNLNNYNADKIVNAFNDFLRKDRVKICIKHQG